MTPLLPEPVCVVDVETWNAPGGGRHQLVEIAALLLDVDGVPVRGHLRRDGRSLGRGPAVKYQRLCRPAGIPSSPAEMRMRNALNPRWLFHSNVGDEADVVRDFVEWHFGCAMGAPLIAYNNAFDRSALRGALALSGDIGDLNWGRCLMLEATERLMLRKSDGRIRRKASKSEVAELLFGSDVPKMLKHLAHQVDWKGPLTMHLAFPDVLLESGILIELLRRNAIEHRVS